VPQQNYLWLNNIGSTLLSVALPWLIINALLMVAQALLVLVLVLVLLLAQDNS
jgi:hypothetical protein